MRVCDISKREDAKSRYAIIELNLDGSIDNLSGGRVVHDFEVGSTAAAHLEAKNWKGLHDLTPRDERPKDEKRAAAAKQAATTRKANKEKAEHEDSE